MKRITIIAMLGMAILLLGVTSAVAAVIGPDNPGFEDNQAPRAGYQGWDNEYIYGWKPFSASVWLEKGADHVVVEQNPDIAQGHFLKLNGVDANYVGVRSVHMPVTPMSLYTATAQGYVKEMADPSRLQIWLEFWPASPKAESATYRLKYSKAVAGSLGNWEKLEVSDVAPADAATATILIIINKSGKSPLVPAEVYVDNVQLEQVQ